MSLEDALSRARTEEEERRRRWEREAAEYWEAGRDFAALMRRHGIATNSVWTADGKEESCWMPPLPNDRPHSIAVTTSGEILELFNSGTTVRWPKWTARRMTTHGSIDGLAVFARQLLGET